MSYRTMLSRAALMIGVLGLGAVAPAGIAPLKESVTVNHAAGDATFSIDFSHPPDLFTVDSANRPADAFAVEIAANPSGPNPLAFENLTTIINGSEIHLSNTLPVRNAFPAVSTKSAGGWGSVRGTVPYTVSGDTLSFTAPLQTLGAPNGKFAYQVFTTHFGSEVASSSGSTAVPLPSALMAGMMMLGCGILFSVCRSAMAARKS